MSTADAITQLSSALAGRYEIHREIGHGGMATVYLARDIRHSRPVALKVLNPELGAVLGVERFLAEIQVTANLQHPNLLPLFDSGEANGLLYYVMPYVEGESLRARLLREKQLPVDEAVRIASTIAHALDYAHRHSVIHRDLKPENVLMHEGQPLIADFGIALAVSNAGGARITQTGLSLGTPQYMSPEQATGDRVVDGRTDIYSLGAITHEMLVGDPPHVASTAQAVIAKVLTERVTSVRTSRPNVPPHVDAAVMRALEKLAADRFGSARELADALEGRNAGSGAVASAPAPAAAPAATASRRRIGAREVVAWTLVLVLGAVAAWSASQRPEPTDSPVVRLNLDLPPGTRVNDVVTGSTIAVSPRGDMLAFTAIGMNSFRMYLRRVSELAPRELADAVGRNLTFSPDGRWLAYTEGNVLKKIPVDGGQPQTVSATGGTVAYGVTWADTDTIYIGGFSGLWAVSAAGGTATPVGGDSVAARVGRRWPVALPGGRAVVFADGSSSASPPRLAALEVGTGKITVFNTLAATPLGMIDDYLVYVSPGGALMALPFDVAAATPTGNPIQLDEGVLVDPTAGSKASLSPSGTLAYLRGRAQFQPVTVSATTQPVPMIREPGTYSNPRYSPDGTRVAITVVSTNATDIWIYDIRRNTFTRLTTEGANLRPEWTPDGRHVLFVSTRAGATGIWRQPADGSGPAELLYQPELEPFEALVSPDMKWLLFRTAPGSKHSRDILIVPLGGTDRTVTPLVTSQYTESLPRLSPNGRWLAYQSNESGRFEIYVRPFPGSGARVQVSDNGGTEAVWSRSGTSLYYRGTLGEVVQVGVTTAAEFSIGERKVVLTGDYLSDASHANYDVAPDGRFLMLKRAGAESQTIVVHNWARELREKTAGRR